MKKCLLRAVAILITATIAISAFAGDDPASLKGFNRESLEVYLSRADAEKDKDAWLSLAGLGEKAVLADWERAATHLYDSGEEREKARALVGAEVVAMSQEHYRSWLVRRFLAASGADGGFDGLRRSVDSANLELLYERGADGKVKRDSRNDPLLRGQAGLEADRSAWAAKVGSAIEAGLGDWQGRVDAASAELLREFGGRDLDAARSELSRAALAQKEGYRRELMALFTQEEGRFVSLRSYDSYSLKNKSSEDAALAVTDRLIRETKGGVEGSLAKIRDGLATEAARPEASTDVETAEWLASFKRTFEAGLAKWDGAEETFLAERVEWERNAGADYRSGEEAWAAAYKRLQGERTTWEASVRLELDRGRNEWGAKRAELGATIDRAKRDFEAESSERKAASDTRVSAVVDLYAQSASMVSTAMSSGGFWTEKIKELRGFDTASYKAWFSARLADYGSRLGQIRATVTADLSSQEESLKAARADLAEVNANINGDSHSIVAPVKYTTTEVHHRRPGGRAGYGDVDVDPDIEGQTYTVDHYWVLSEYLAFRKDGANATIARLEKDIADKKARLARLESLSPELSKVAAAGGAIVVTDSVRAQVDLAVTELYFTASDSEKSKENGLWEAYREGAYWLVQKTKYQKTLEDARQSLKDCLADTLADGSSLPALQSVLGHKGDAEGLYLDEYQIELLRAEALKAFWEKRLAIATAVKTYADQKTSDRPTEASQRDAYAAALAAYGARKASYDELVKSLSSLGADLGASRASLDAAQTRLAAASAALAKAEADFSSILALYDIGSSTYFNDRIGAAFTSLDGATSMEEGKDGLYDAMLSYIEAGRRYGFQDELRASRRSLEELVNGRANLADPAASVASASALEKAVADARQALADNPRPANAAEAGVALGDPYIPLLNALFQSMKDATGDERSYGEANVRLLLGKRLEGLVATLEERKSAIRLLASESEASWLDAEGVAPGSGGSEARLSAAAKAAGLAELRARSGLEKRMLDRARAKSKNPGASYDFTDNVDIGAWAILHRPAAAGGTVKMSDAEIAARSSLLASLDERLDAGATEADLAAWVKAQKDPGERGILDEFLAGRGAAQGASGLDLVLLAAAHDGSDHLARLSAILEKHGAEAPGSAALRRDLAISATGKTLSDLGVGKAGPAGLELVAVELVAARIDGMGERELAEWAIRVDAARQRSAPGLGAALAEELGGYYARLLDYASLSAARRGIAIAGAEASASAAAAELAAAGKVAEDLSIALGGAGGERRLSALASVLAWADGSGSRVRLETTERASLEAAFLKSAGVLVVNAMGDLVSSGKDESEATWELAMTQALAGVAPGGLSPARKAGLLAEAKRLRALDAELASGTATSREGKRLLAFAAWKGFDSWLSVEKPVPAAKAAALSTVYGKFSAAFPDGLSSADADANEASIKAIAKFIDDSLPTGDRAEAKAFLADLAAAPPATTAALALSRICPGLDPADHARFAAQSGGALYERALALTIASSLSGPDARAAFTAIQGLSGLECHGSLADSDFGPAAKDSIRERSLSGLLASDMGDDARAFDAMGRAFAGSTVDPSALGLDGETKKLLSDFLAVLAAKRGYVPSLSGSPADYAAVNADATGLTATELEAALSSGYWLSPFFLAPSSDPAAPGYLALYARFADAELASAAALARSAASAGVAAFNDELALARSRLAFATSIGAAKARLVEDSYRAYSFEPPKDSTDKRVSFETTTAVKADTATIRYRGADPGMNALLEAATELDRAGAYLKAASAAPGAAEAAERKAARDDFLSAASSYLGGAAWKAADSADSEAARAAAAATQGELDLAGRKLATLASTAASAKANIQKFGSALSGFDATARETRLAALRAAVESAKTESGEAQKAIQAASAAFETKIDAYNTAYRDSRRAYDDLETARWDLALKDEVLEYAQNGYLRPTDSTSDYRGPADQLAYAQDKNARAGAALDILKSLYASGDKERSASEDRYAAYRETYRQYLEMRKFQGDLFTAIAQQEQTVQAKEAAYQKELGKILKGAYPNPFYDSKTNATMTTRASDDADKPTWSNYLKADSGGYGVALNLDGYHLVKTTEAEWTEAKKGFEGIADSDRRLSQSQLNAEKWGSDLAAYAVRLGEAGFKAHLDDWARALTYLRLMASEAEDAKTNPFGMLSGTGGASSFLNENGALDSSTKTPGGDLSGTVSGAEAASRAMGKAAYDRIMQGGNEEEQKLWNYAVAMHLSGNTGSSTTDPFKFLDYGSRLDTYQQVKGSLESSAQGYGRDKNQYLTMAAVDVGLAAFFWFALPVAAVYAAEAVIFGGCALDALVKENQCKAIVDKDINHLITFCADTTGAAKTALCGGLKSLSAARADLDKERSALDAIKGKSSTPITDSASVLASMEKAYSLLGKGSPSADVKRLITSHMPMMGNVYTSADVVSRTVALLADERSKDYAAGDSQSEDDRASMRHADEAYRKALAAWQAGKGSEAELRAKAAAAFKNPSYTFLSQKKNEIAFQMDGILASPVTENESYEEERINSVRAIGEAIKSLYDKRLSGEEEARAVEWSDRQSELALREADWNARISATAGSGMKEWDEGTKRLQSSFEGWKTSYTTEYQSRTDAWKKAYLDFQERKQTWTEKVAAKAGQASVAATFGDIAESADYESRVTNSQLLSGLSLAKPDPDAELDKALDRNTLARILEASARSNERIGDIAYAFRSGIKASASSTSAREAARALVAERSGEMATHAARIVARQARDNVETAKKSYEQALDDANTSFENGLTDQFGGQSYAKLGGGGWSREAIIGSTLVSGVVTERQSLASYERYRTEFKTTTNLDDGRLASYDAAGVEILVEKAMKELEKERDRVFGGKDDKETVLEQKIYDSTYTDPDAPKDTRNFLEKTWDKVVETFTPKNTSANRTVKLTLGAGEFTAHIGYAPTLKQVINPDESYSQNLLVEGKGQLGRIMGYFEYYQARQGKGYSEVKKPVYDKRIWNDEGSAMKSPTIRSTVNIGVSIAAMAIGNPWIAMAVNLADDAVFTALDVSGGYKTMGQAGLDLGKQALVGMATTGLGQLGGSFMGQAANKLTGAPATGLMKMTGMGGLVARTAFTGVQAYATNTVSSAINAIELDKAGKLVWNDDSFLEGTLGKSAMASYASGMASSFTSSYINSGLDVTDRKLYAGAIGLASSGAGELARYGTYLGAEYLGGGDFSAAAGRAFDGMGGITINALNLGSILDLVGSISGTTNASGQSGLGGIAQKLSGAGLLELHIGSSGVSANLGMGGVDVGGNLYRMGKGMVDKSIIDAYIAQDATKGGIARAAYGYGDWSAENTVRRLGLGKDKLTLLGADSHAIARDAKAMTVQNNDGSGRQIYMHDRGSGQNDILNMAVTLQHEAYRDGLLGANNGAETYSAALAHTQMAMRMMNSGEDGFFDPDLVSDIMAYRNGTFGQHVATSYDSTADYWLVKKNGDIVDDGNDGRISFEDGRAAIETKDKRKQGSLEEFLGLEYGTLNGTLDRAGFVFEKGAGWTSAGKTIEAEEIRKLIKSGVISDPEAIRSLQGSPSLGDERSGLIATAASLYSEGLAKKAECEMAFWKDPIGAAKDLLLALGIGKKPDEGKWTPAETRSGDGTIYDPYVTQDQKLLSMNDISKLFGLSSDKAGPCFIAAALDAFAIQGKSPEELMNILAQYKNSYLDSNLGVSGSMTELWELVQAKAGGDIPGYAELDAAGRSVEMPMSDFLKSGYSMALMGAWKPGSQSEDPDHWLFTYKMDGKWYVDESWRISGALPQRWGQDNWIDINRVYRPLSLSTKK
jgi:hypothetical protein